MQIAMASGSRRFPVQVAGVRALLLTDVQDGRTAHRLARCGSLVDVTDRLDLALSRLRDDPMGYDVFVMDCDGYGGISGGELAVSSLIAAEAKMRVLLVSREFDEPALPFGRRTAVCLPTAVGEDDFCKGFAHVLRDRVPSAMM
jgi:hypothetical protein